MRSPDSTTTRPRKALNLLQWAGFLSLATVSLFFTCNLALGLGVDRAEKAALVGGSMALELLKLYLLIAGNTAWSDGKRTRSLALYGVYGFIACYSLMACFGYALATVDRVGAASAAVNHQDDISLEQHNLALYADEIAALQLASHGKLAALGGIPADHLARKIEIQRSMGQDQGRIEDLIQKCEGARAHIAEWRAEEIKTAAGHRRTMYQVLGETLGVSPKWIAFIILGIFSSAIELGIIVTSPHAGNMAQTPKAASTRTSNSNIKEFFRQGASQNHSSPQPASATRPTPAKIARKPTTGGRVAGYLSTLHKRAVNGN
jgi:hypothetical protein